jgi:Rod binding domain-containing protein
MDLANPSYLPTAADRAVQQSGLLARRLEGRKPDRDSSLYKVCLEFEAIFIKQMLNSMRRTVQKSGLFEGGLAEDIFEDMLYDEYAKKMAENAKFGLAAMIYSQIQPSF